MAPALPRSVAALAALCWAVPTTAAHITPAGRSSAPAMAKALLDTRQLPPYGDFDFDPNYQPSKYVHHRKAKKSEAKEEKPAEGKKDEKGEKKEEVKELKEEAEHAATLVGFMVISGVCIASAVFAMAQTKKKHVAPLTWSTLDLVIAIFIAVLWFQAIFDLIEWITDKDHHETIMAVVVAFSMLLVVMLVSFKIRSRQTSLAIFCSCGAHFVSFASMGAATVIQDHHFDDTPLQTLVSTLIFVALTAIVGVVLYFVKRFVLGVTPGVESKDETKNDWNEKFDDVENDFAAMAVALAWTAFVRFLIVGEFPDEETVEPGEMKDHVAVERTIMLIYAIVILICTALITRAMEKLVAGRHTYARDRWVMFLKSVLTFACAWAFLLWGQMEVLENSHLGQPVFGRLVFAVYATAAVIIAVVACAHFRTSAPTVRTMQNVFLSSLALVVGWAWEESFDECLEGIAEAQDDGSSKKHWIKLALAMFCGAVVLPVYAIYLKPIVHAIEEREAKEAK